MGIHQGMTDRYWDYEPTRPEDDPEAVTTDNRTSKRWRAEWGEEPPARQKPVCWCGHEWNQHSNSMRKDRETGEQVPVKGRCSGDLRCCDTYDPRTYVSKERMS